MTPTSPEQELRAMIGDLFMQLAMVRAELANAKAGQQAQPNGHDREAEHDHRPQPG